MNVVIKRICNLTRSLYNLDEILENKTLEYAFENNIIKTYFYLKNSSKYFLKIDDDYQCANFEELKSYKETLLSLFKNFCVVSGLLNKEEDLIIEDILSKMDNFFGFRVDFPDIFDKDEFSWLPYLNYNPDLTDHGIFSEDGVHQHWEEYGINEKRTINGSFGLLTSRGIISKKYIESLFCILKVKQLLGDRRERVTIFDINGEIGITSYYLKKMGFDDIVVVNKPEFCLVASYYLLSLFNDDDVTLYNEDSDNSIIILPIYKYVSLLDKVNYFIHREGENINLIDKKDYDPRDFNKKFILISLNDY